MLLILTILTLNAWGCRVVVEAVVPMFSVFLGPFLEH
jgi:hypothetical protein